MLNSLKAANLGLRPLLAILLSLALWAALWLSLASGPGDIQGILKPGSPMGFLYGLRAIFPIAAAAVAILIILAGVSQLRLRRFLFVSPLGLAALYGLVGLASSLLSPSRLVALYWAVAYLSVPLVLWAILRGADTTGRLRRLINFNWLLVTLLLGASALVAVASGYLDLGSLISDPSALLDCRLSTSWFNATGGVLRQTGVGRYAAVVGLIALAGLWRGSWRPAWSLVLVGSVALLLATGARTAFLGFAAAAVFVVLLYEGKRALVAGAVALIVLVPLAWGTGVHQSFLNSCILREGVDSSAKPQAPVQLGVPPANWVLVQVLPREPGSATAPAQITLSPGEWVLQESPLRAKSGTEPAIAGASVVALLEGAVYREGTPEGYYWNPSIGYLPLPAGTWEWVLRPSPSLPKAPSGQPRAPATAPAQITLPSGAWAVQESPLGEKSGTEPAIAGASVVALPESVTYRKGTPEGYYWNPHVGYLQLPKGAAYRDGTPDGYYWNPNLGYLPLPVATRQGPLAVAPAPPDQQPAADSVARVSPEEEPGADSVARVSPEEEPGADSVARVSPKEPPAAVPPSGQPHAPAPAATELPEPVHVPTGEWAPEGIPGGFFTFTGRTVVWAEGWKLFTFSPLLGFGFHADRLVLGQHMHNSYMHALVQTGLIGAIPFLAAILLGWVLLLKALRNLARLPVFDKHLVILTGGILAFLTIRSLLESTGAFFGVDWLLLAPLLLYLQVVNHSEVMGGRSS